MIRAIQPDDWQTADGMELEENADDVARSTESKLVVAGPGAGKTELLAQRACYLLETNTCRYPYRILALSFKTDAAYNLRARVKLRCTDELSLRFDSYTFDAFAKQILNRFRAGLPDAYRITGNYEMQLRNDILIGNYRGIVPDFVGTRSSEEIVQYHTETQLPLTGMSAIATARMRIWQSMLAANPSRLTFPMSMRMAELIVSANPLVRQYLQQTYSFVFLDEFQDTTTVHYDFFKTCFLGSGSVFTAVGDDKQRIMSFAGAKPEIFDEFTHDTGAEELPLTMNFRSAPKLVELQNHLVEHLLHQKGFAVSSSKWPKNSGECFLWYYNDTDQEKRDLYKCVTEWIKNEGINPREICILVKQWVSEYTQELATYFNANGLRARDESELQNVLSDDCSNYVIETLRTAVLRKSPDAKRSALSFLRNIYSEKTSEQMILLENRFAVFTSELAKRCITKAGTKLTEAQLNQIIDDIIVFAEKGRLTTFYPAYRNGPLFDKVVTDLKKAVWQHYRSHSTLPGALESLIGVDTIPIMTIHKSKGLEYQTVIFVGVEDAAFWTFSKQPDNDKRLFFVALSRAKYRVVFTVCKTRTIRTASPTSQTTDNIQVIFEELENSGIVDIEEK